MSRVSLVKLLVVKTRRRYQPYDVVWFTHVLSIGDALVQFIKRISNQNTACIVLSERKQVQSLKERHQTFRLIIQVKMKLQCNSAWGELQ